MPSNIFSKLACLSKLPLKGIKYDKLSFAQVSETPNCKPKTCKVGYVFR